MSAKLPQVTNELVPAIDVPGAQSRPVVICKRYATHPNARTVAAYVENTDWLTGEGVFTEDSHASACGVGGSSAVTAEPQMTIPTQG